MGICKMESVVFDLSKSRRIRKRGSLPELFHGLEGMLFHRRGGGIIVDRRNRLSADLTGLNPDWPIQFHEVHGDNVALSVDKARARRADSFCKSICFSNRPIAVNERVYLRFVQTSSSWSGVLRFGFTSTDPGSTRGPDLPRYACPDMTNKPGNWAKALGERYAAINNVLHFWFNRNGDVMYGINGEDIGLFFSGVATNVPLWALMDIYGNTIEIEFIKPEPPMLNNMLNRPSISMPAEISAITSQMTAMTSGDQAPPNTVVQSQSLPIKYYTMTRFSLMQFHKLNGKNIQITDPSRTIAFRSPEEFCNGYVFSSRPLKCGEKIVLQVLGIDRSYVGGLAVGFTTCSPDSVSQSELPDDADLLLDRMEYWVVNKDVYRSPEIGDELCFHLTNDGEVRYSRNNSKVATLMHVDRTLPLWIFFDIYGNIQKIRCLGVAPHQPPVPPRPRSTSYLTQGPLSVALPRPERPIQPASQNIANSHTSSLQQQHLLQQQQQQSMTRSFSVPSGVHNKSSPPVPPKKSHSVSTPTSPTENTIPENENNECTVCYEREVNSVLYKCGHVCMCFECAIQVKDKGSLCPICRQTIHDVIKIYKT